MMAMKEHKVIDLFCGCGGLSLGLEQAGFKVAFASDIDSNCASTYQKNFNIKPDQMYVGDIRDLNKNNDLLKSDFKGIDLVCGGPPCQGFSMANRQRIIDDPRNFLYKEYLLFLSKIQPNFFIIENVRGMLNKINEIIEDINNVLGAKYNVAFHLFNVKDYGVPQNRERLIIIGNKIGINSQTIIDSIIKKATTIPQYTLFDAIGDLPELKPNRLKNSSKIENDSIGYFCKEYKYKNTKFRCFINDNRKITKLYNHKNRYNNDRDIEIYTRLPQGANSLHESIKDIMPYKSRNDIFKDKYFKLEYNKVCKTITSHMMYDCNMYIHPTQSRGLSPREAARIQTFPDDFILYGPQNKWYKQVGNAVPVKFARVIGEEIIKYL